MPSHPSSGGDCDGTRLAHRTNEVAVVQSVLALVFVLGTASLGSRNHHRGASVDRGGDPQKYLDDSRRLEKAYPRMVYGHGTLSCAEWSADRTQTTPDPRALTPPGTSGLGARVRDGRELDGTVPAENGSRGHRRVDRHLCVANPHTNVAEASIRSSPRFEQAPNKTVLQMSA